MEWNTGQLISLKFLIGNKYDRRVENVRCQVNSSYKSPVLNPLQKRHQCQKNKNGNRAPIETQTRHVNQKKLIIRQEKKPK